MNKRQWGIWGTIGIVIPLCAGILTTNIVSRDHSNDQDNSTAKNTVHPIAIPIDHRPSTVQTPTLSSVGKDVPPHDPTSVTTNPTPQKTKQPMAETPSTDNTQPSSVPIAINDTTTHRGDQTTQAQQVSAEVAFMTEREYEKFRPLLLKDTRRKVAHDRQSSMYSSSDNGLFPSVDYQALDEAQIDCATLEPIQVDNKIQMYRTKITIFRNDNMDVQRNQMTLDSYLAGISCVHKSFNDYKKGKYQPVEF